jgi:hypothetical protein
LCYAGLGVLAALTLDGGFRWVVLLLLAAFALKSWIAVRREELDGDDGGAGT